MKRWISLSLCFLLFLGLIIPALLVVPVSAAVTASGTISSNISWSIDDGVLTISGVGAMSSLGGLSSVPWYDYISSIFSVVVSSGITNIGSYFSSNFDVDTIVLPSTLTAVSSRAFAYCSIDTLSLPDGISSLPARCFGSSKINSLYIPASVTSIDSLAFMDFEGTIYLASSAPPSFSPSYMSSFYTFVVPYGSKDAYLAASGWSSIAGHIVEAEPLSPSIPTLTTSFAGQVININAGSINLFIYADNVNGDLTCEWYINGVPYGEVYEFVQTSSGIWALGWQYTPIGDGTRELYAIVKNTLNGEVASISTGTVIVNVGSGSGGGAGDGTGDGSGGDSSGLSDKLDSVQQEVENVKGSVDAVNDRLDTVEVDIDEMQETLNSVAADVEKLPDDIQNGMQNVIDGEKENATNAGGNYVDQILDLVPNESQGFIDSMGSFVSTLSYNGVDCVLSLPAVNLPAIPGLFSSCKLMDAQQIDFSEFFDLFPTNILLLVQSLFTIALIVYCFKELYSVISYFLTLKGDDK